MPVLAVIALSAAVVMPAAPVQSGKAVCQTAPSLLAARPREAVRMKRLGEMPPAKLYRAVLRTEGGCVKPVIIRENIGGR